MLLFLCGDTKITIINGLLNAFMTSYYPLIPYTMICSNCNATYASGKFCPECGSVLIPNDKQTEMKENSSNHDLESGALFQLAKDYEYGNGVIADISKAFELYIKAAQDGNADAMCHVGYLMMFGYGVDRHTGNAFYWLDKGISNSNNPNSIYYKNACKICLTIKSSKSKLNYEPARYDVLLRNIKDYNEIAMKVGYMPLYLKDNHLMGSILDDFSNYTGDEHYRDYVKLASANVPRGPFASAKHSYYIGRLGVLVKAILGDIYTLQID